MALEHIGSAAATTTAVVASHVVEVEQEWQSEGGHTAVYAPVVVNSQIQAPSTESVATQAASIAADMATRGISTIKFDWTSFPMIALKTEGAFEDSSGRSYGKSFQAKIVQNRIKYAHSFDGSKDPKNELMYSYDKITSTNGKSVDEFLATLRAKGKGPEITCKEYTELLVEMIAPDDEDLHEDFRLLSISPSAQGAYSAFAFRLDRKREYNTAIIEFSCGEKVRTVANPYYPWAFAKAKQQ
jgi:hypothetical protein